MPAITVGGIDRDGTGAVYSFDPVGSYERESCRAAGAAQSLVQPFLDNMVRLYISLFAFPSSSLFLNCCATPAHFLPRRRVPREKDRNSSTSPTSQLAGLFQEPSSL